MTPGRRHKISLSLAYNTIFFHKLIECIYITNNINKSRPQAFSAGKKKMKTKCGHVINFILFLRIRRYVCTLEYKANEWWSMVDVFAWKF